MTPEGRDNVFGAVVTFLVVFVTITVCLFIVYLARSLT